MKRFILNIVAVVALFSAANAQVDINKMPVPGPTPTVNVAQPETFKLANGLTVLVVENHKLPRVSAQLSIDRPPIFEGDKAGFTSLLGDLLGSGTATMSKDDFNKRVDYLGARVRFSGSGAFMQSLSKYFPEVLGLMANAATQPKFTQEELTKSQDRFIESLKADEKSTEAIANRVFSALTYGKNSARGEFSTEKSIKNVTLADIQSAYQNYYTPQNAYLVIVGDVKFDEVKKLVEKYFSQWKKSPFTFKPLEKVPVVAKTQIDVVNVPNAVQSVIKVGNVHQLTMSSPDFFPAIASNYILGGGGEARLFMNLREKNGYTYGAYSSLNTGKYAQDFNANASVRTEVTDLAVKEFLNELKIMNEIKPEELSKAKSKLEGSFIMSLENPETIARFALNKYIYNLPDNFYNNYLKSVDNMTLDQVKRAYQQYLQPEKLRIFVAGKATDFADKLEALGYPVNYYDAYANPVAKPEIKKADADVSVASVGKKFIDAIGGQTAVEKIKSITMEASTTVQGMQLEMNIISESGGKINQSMKMAGNVIQKMIFDGTEGYIEAQGKKMPLPDDVKKSLTDDMELFPELNFDKTEKYTLAPIENINGEDAIAVKGTGITYYYSTTSGLKVGEMKTQNMQGKETTVPTFYSDYKEVEGIKMPFTIKQSMGGMEIPLTVKSYHFNQATPDDFETN